MTDIEEIIEIDDLGARYYHEYCHNSYDEEEEKQQDEQNLEYIDNPLDEVYHDIKANEDTADYMEEFSKIKQDEYIQDINIEELEECPISSSKKTQNNDDDDDDDNDNDEDSDDEEDDKIDNYEFEEMEVFESKQFCLKILQYIQQLEDNVQNENNIPFLYQYLSFESSSIWESDMNSNKIGFSSFLSNRFIISICLFMYKMIYNSNYDSIKDLRKIIVENVILKKRQYPLLKQKFIDIHIYDIYSKEEFEQIPIPTLFHLIYHSEFFYVFDIIRYKMFPELNMMMEYPIDYDLHCSTEFSQYSMNSLQITSLQSLIDMYQI